MKEKSITIETYGSTVYIKLSAITHYRVERDKDGALSQISIYTANSQGAAVIVIGEEEVVRIFNLLQEYM